MPTDITTLENTHILKLHISVSATGWRGGPASFLRPQLLGDTSWSYLTFRQCCSQCLEHDLCSALCSVSYHWVTLQQATHFLYSLDCMERGELWYFFPWQFSAINFYILLWHSPSEFLFCSCIYFCPLMGFHFPFSPLLSRLGNIYLCCLVSPLMTGPVY